MFSTTGAYSPRNEAYVNADRFLKLWYEVMGREITPFSEYFTSPHEWMILRGAYSELLALI